MASTTGRGSAMKRGVVAATILAALALPWRTGAEEFRSGTLVVAEPWARASMGRTGAAYVSIANRGGATDRLVKVATPVARRADIHTHVRDGDILRMRRVPDLTIKPGETTVFRPGGLHIMLMGLDAPLRKGASFPMTLTFQHAGEIAIKVPVHGIAAMGPGPGHRMHR